MLHLPSIDRDTFDVDPRPVGVLVTPKRSKSTWTPEEIPLRSVLCTADGEVLSRGLPKFFNHGENAAHDAETHRLLASGAPVMWQEKLDGTLIIRSIIDGTVHLRTRGNDTLKDFTAPVLALIGERYSAVLDPTVGDPTKSLVFEYTSPTNRIVVAYDHPRMTPLGEVDRATGRVEPGTVDLDITFGMARPSVRHFQTRDPVAIAAETAQISGDEGVVAWIKRARDDWHLVKFKSLWWLRAHALASFATYDRIREFAWAEQIPSEEAFVEALQRAGVDYEIASMHVGLFREVHEDSFRRICALRDGMNRCADVLHMPDRKSKALALKDREPALFGPLMAWACGEETLPEWTEAHTWGWTRAQLTNLKRKPRTPLVLDLESSRRAE